GVVTVTLEDGTRAQVAVSDVNEVEAYLAEQDFTEYTLNDVPGESIWISILPSVIVLVAVIFMIMMMSGQASGGGSGSRMMNFGKSRAKMTTGENVGTKFSDVAGLREEKEELEGMVDFLKAPGKYTRLGARIPKGVLLVGPPGTGKTLIAKAVAGEAGVPFFSISGSDFVEMFVGVGASRVRDMFVDAKKHAPCIVFIDEIDAVGRRRGTGMGGGHDEREQTLNQLLVEMDGFGVNEGIIVVAATNRVDILDPALLRPGRFDRKVYVGKPDVAGREQILNVHAQNKPLGDDVDLKQIAQTTAGFTGADLENLLNESAIIAAKDQRAFVCQEDIRKAFIKVGIGAEKKSRVITEKEKRITAFHESGHAILFHVLPDVGPVYTVSIIPTGVGAAGYTMPLPERDEMFQTKGQMLQEIMVDMGGRIAEELVFDDVTTGASQDIKQATAVAKAMVTKYGMSEAIGPINYDNDDDEVFIGRDLAHTKGYSDEVAKQIDAEIRRIVEECYRKAKEIIVAHKDILYRSAELLLEKEKIGRAEFESLFSDSEKQPVVTE
ncbi:MAG: ATP-dependent zinc metalloprotease FtsH, partial [Clostridiales bacterium]|nr:ATP-dependent zinc metalloprotease FtsH [Clostridiales bacterium]